MKKIVAISDLQVPLHDKRAVDNVAAFIKAYKPDTVVSVGDEADFTGISRWAHGTPLQFETNLHKEREATVAVLEKLKVEHVIRSNHTDRLFNTIKMRVPEFRHLPELELSTFLKFDELGITYHQKPYELAPGWVLAHGDEGSISQKPGQTALSLAEKFGKSVICGHTHRMGVTHRTFSVAGKPTLTLWGMEVGNLMDMRKATYLKAGSGNWQQGFGLLTVDGRKVTPTLVPIHTDGTFVVDGKRFGK